MRVLENWRIPSDATWLTNCYSWVRTEGTQICGNYWGNGLTGHPLLVKNPDAYFISKDFNWSEMWNPRCAQRGNLLDVWNGSALVLIWSLSFWDTKCANLGFKICWRWDYLGSEILRKICHTTSFWYISMSMSLLFPWYQFSFRKRTVDYLGSLKKLVDYLGVRENRFTWAPPFHPSGMLCHTVL